MQHNITKPTDNDLDELFKNLRISDVLELKASCGCVTREVIAKSVDVSIWTGCLKDYANRVIAVGGVTKEGCIWLLGTSLVKKNKSVILDLPTVVMNRVRNEYGINKFFNYVMSSNTTSISWLKRNGFIVGEPMRFGAENKHFRYFERII